jgi:hypothetical protein
LLRAVREAGLTVRVSVQSFDWRTLVVMRRIAPEIAHHGSGERLRVRRVGARRRRQFGFNIEVIQMGVAGIITDYPNRLRAVMAEKEIPLPPAVATR